MYPGPQAPDLGTFVRDLERALEARGHELERAVLDHRAGGKRRYLELARRGATTARRFRPDVVHAHFLVSSGLIAAIASRAPFVVTAHGRDVGTVGAIPGTPTPPLFVARRAAAVGVVSDYLRRELEAKVPDARHKTHVVDSGVDLERFREFPTPNGEPRYLCVGSLTPRKNVLRLARAFERLGEGRGTLTFVGDGPLRHHLEGRRDIVLAGRVPHDEVPRHVAAAHVVCQPSLVEPFGQALLEAMACGIAVVASARDGKEAVRLWRKLRPDVILMDISMPIMDGFEATRRIRREREDACVLMLTGSNSRTDVDLARKAGAAGYVTKDRIAAELIEAIVEIAAR